MVGGAALLALTLLTVVRPLDALIMLIIVAVLVPIEASVKLGALPRIGPLRAAIFAYGIGLVIRTLLTRRWPIGRLSGPPLSALALYVAVTMVSALLSIDLMTTAYALIDQALLLVFFLLFWSTCRDDAAFERLLAGVFIATGIACFFAFLQAAFKFTLPPPFGIEASADVRIGIERIRGSFFHPIALGAFLDLVFPFVLIKLMTPQARGRLWLGALAIAIIAAQVLTVSRIPWLIMVIETAFVWVMVRPSINRLASLAAVALGGLVVLGLIAASGATWFEALFGSMLTLGGGDEASSEAYRLILTQAVMAKLEGIRWFVGMGPGTFHMAGYTAIYAGVEHVLEAPDLHYVRVLADTGLGGLAAFGFLLASIVAVCLRSIARAPFALRPQAVACAAAVIGFILVNATVSFFYIWPLALTFWLISARAAVLSQPAANRLATPHRAHLTVPTGP